MNPKNRNLKVVLLTTETAHHLYYAWKLSERIFLRAIFFETQIKKPSFDTFHPFETRRDLYERDTLLSGCQVTFEDLADHKRYGHINEAAQDLERLSPDVLLVFGTGKLLLPLIRIPKRACLNLHGGNPEYYRGLDSHLWAIYHEDFGHLTSTLHGVDEELDTGDIVFQRGLKIHAETELWQLRAINTQACLEMSLQALDLLESRELTFRKQVRRGKYYSFMPSALKETCVKKFENYRGHLKSDDPRLLKISQ